ncbi:MAG: hypothetical protein U0P45_05050 [Acidimicrobiales bacterium]
MADRAARVLRAEVGKLLTIGTLVLLAMFTAVVWKDLGRFTDFAAGQTPMAVAAQHTNQALADRCHDAGSTEGECAGAEQTLQLNRHFAPNAVALGRRAMAVRTVPGILTFVAHQLGSGLGWLVLGMLAAIHVTRERAARTVEQSVVRTGRALFLVGKAASTWLASVALLMGSTVVLTAIRPTFTNVVLVPPATVGVDVPHQGVGSPLAADPSWSSWAGALGAAGRCLLVTLMVCTTFSLLAAAFRDPIAAAVTLGGGVIAMFVVVDWWGHPGWVPERAVAAALGSRGGPFGSTDMRLWDPAGRPSSIYLPAMVPPVPAFATVAWLAVAATLTVLAARSFLQRRTL